MSQITFTILITTYNRLTLLKRAIDSALNQTITAQVVVIDDASNDQMTCEYLQELSDRHPQIIHHRNPTNLGHSKSINQGVDLANGNWIKLLDDDDYLAPNCLEVMRKAISAHESSAICTCLAKQVDPTGQILSITPITGSGHTYYIPQEALHYGMLIELIPIGTPVQVAFRKDYFLKSGGWDSGFDTNFDDIDSWVKICQFGDGLFINECLAYRTIWDGGYNQKIPYTQRLSSHIIIKKKIYHLVSPKYQSIKPSIVMIEQYLTLHWAIVALKQRALTSFLKIGFKAFFNLSAWWLLIKIRKERSSNTPLIPKYILSSETA